MLNISSKTKSHILVLIFGPHVPLWLPSIVTLHYYILLAWFNYTPDLITPVTKINVSIQETCKIIA